MLPVLALLFTLTAAAPVYAWTCNSITFTSSSTSGSPIIMAGNSQTFGPSGNKISYSDFSGQYMYVYITGITSGWTVTITSSSTVTTLSPTQIIVGPLSDSSFSYTIQVTGPGTANTAGQFTINAVPDSSSSSITGGNLFTSGACSSLTVYLKTPPTLPPPAGVPMFPLGMALAMAAAFPALLLAKRKFAGTSKL